MIKFNAPTPDVIEVEISCELCRDKHVTRSARPVLHPAASEYAERQAIAAGWKRNVPIQITRPRVTKYDGDGRPETVENEPGTMTGDLCPGCIKATEAT